MVEVEVVVEVEDMVVEVVDVELVLVVVVVVDVVVEEVVVVDVYVDVDVVVKVGSSYLFPLKWSCLLFSETPELVP